MKILKNHWLLIIICFLALVTRFWNLGYPAEVVFDEVHFGKFVSGYFTHQYYFDIHPPLGKMMIAGFAKISGLNLTFDFNVIGEKYDSNQLFILRFLPALFGAIFIIVIYQLILAIGCSKIGAFLGAFMVIFDNAFLTESKFILMDLFLLVFGFSSLLFFILSRKTSGKKQIFLLFAAGILSGLAFSIKWTALSYLAIILIFSFVDFLKGLKIRQYLLKLSILTIVPLLVYASFFAIHFSLLYKSGPGDAFMSPGFQKGLQGSKIYTKEKIPNFFGKFIELNKRMYTASATLTATHPDASDWYQWPLMKKPIWYWTQSYPDGQVANIYLVGNPLVWLPALIFLFIAITGLFLKNFLSYSKERMQPLLYYFLIAGYFINLLPFILIGRVTFLYHYLSALAFGLIILSLLIDKALTQKERVEIKGYKIKKLREKGIDIQTPKKFLGFETQKYFILYAGFLACVLISFALLSPITYGNPLSIKTNNIYQSYIKMLH